MSVAAWLGCFSLAEFTPRSRAKKPGGFTPRTPQRIWGKMKRRGFLLPAICPPHNV